VGILISFFPGKPSPASSLLGLLSGGSFFYLLALLSRGGMGGGDIKFIAMLGAFTGVKGVILIIILASLIGSSVGITLILLRKKQMRDTLPFGPYLSLGALIVILFQKEIINWYEGNFFFPF
jgi:leader peptidase (prepilin peptidase)/N-methyltransferase